jgi:Flp pilus assembly protein TadG
MASRPAPEPPRVAAARRGPVGRFLADRSAVSAVEFAIVAPLLLILLLGMGGVVPAIVARLQNSHSTEEVGDLVSQFTEMQTSDMVNAYSAASDVQGSLAGATVNLRLTNVYSDGNGHAYVYWSCGEGTLPSYTAKTAVTTTPTGSPVTWFIWLNDATGAGYLRNGTNSTYLMAETSTVYTSPFQFVIQAPITMNDTAYLLPRQSSYIGFPWDGNPADAPTLPTSTTQVQSVTLSNGAICSYAT